jgi:hypothetical protein
MRITNYTSTDLGKQSEDRTSWFEHAGGTMLSQRLFDDEVGPSDKELEALMKELEYDGPKIMHDGSSIVEISDDASAMFVYTQIGDMFYVTVVPTDNSRNLDGPRIEDVLGVYFAKREVGAIEQLEDVVA